jgi:hypothetical protein
VWSPHRSAWHGFSFPEVVARTFVALNDTVHGLLRSMTRQVPLCPCVARDGFPAVQYRVRVEDWPSAYHSLALYHALEGWPARLALARRCRLPLNARRLIAERAGYFDAVRLDRRCSRDLRFKLGRNGPGMVAAELLAYGTGMLRASNDNLNDSLHRHLWREYGHLQSSREVTCARLVALNCHSRHWPGSAYKESFVSTNLIYGDAFGEVEQLWERRADTGFLERVARSLQGLRRRGEVSAFLCPPHNLDGLTGLHLRAQALWRTPPASARALLRRLDYILEHTRVDDSPRTIFRWPASPARPAAGAWSAQGWETDDSGYDGWLSGRSEA